MLYKDIHTSLLRFCTGFKVEQSTEGFDLDAVYFDAHADETTFPEKDVIGISGLSVTTDAGLIELQVMVGVSTLNDTNLFRQVDLIDRLFARLMPENIVKLYDADTGANKGVLKIRNGTRVLPVGGTDARPVQFILVSMGSDQVMPRT